MDCATPDISVSMDLHHSVRLIILGMEIFARLDIIVRKVQYHQDHALPDPLHRQQGRNLVMDAQSNMCAEDSDLLRLSHAPKATTAQQMHLLLNLVQLELIVPQRC